MRSPGYPFASRKANAGRDGHEDARQAPDGSEFSLSSSDSGSLKTSSAGRRTPKTPESSEFSISSAGSNAFGGEKYMPERNPMKIFAGAIVACFTPPETRSGKGDRDAEDLRARSVASDTCGSSERRRSSRGIFTDSYNSTKTEQGGFRFTVSEIYRATRNFSPTYKIGQGGFGTVYKGRLDDGTYVAVKRAKKALYDKHLGVEFRSEVQTLARIEHLNLVKFLGYLEHEDERIIVVEYVPNGTLREHLDGLHGTILDLAARLDVAIDVAHAITYLHMYTDRAIIHRDIKSSNILLTENFRAKVADFGFARSAENDTGATHISTQVKGTAGYLDPEYLRTYQLTEKSDVYSFGVLLVEVVSGRRPIETKKEMKERITARWAMKNFTEGNAILVLDPKLPRNPATNLALEKLLELALQCLAPTRQSRPGMKRCVEILWSIRKDYRELLAMDVRSLSSGSQRNVSMREV
ncbi:calmodulin-binding receptor-like cytoplasmic kinase 2 [Aristolochia californica]|uniref:calmodulin-binding receptor-like cytoplasmic kinase 2 n=1 Tax=Aristolochia californica TaxID=171875 RepID=UPI0035DBCA1C